MKRRKGIEKADNYITLFEEAAQLLSEMSEQADATPEEFVDSLIEKASKDSVTVGLRAES